LGDLKETEMKNFSGTEFGNKAAGFDDPLQLPRDEAERERWQAANKNWWESTPMRYDWHSDISAPAGTEQYYREIDARFLSSVRKFLPWQSIPFDALIPFGELADKDVLEIGVGHGTHAQLIAPHCRSFTGIDLTTYASSMTAKRLSLFGIPGQVLQMDAEQMKFPSGSFDYIWSWGVIHHSANTRRILEEMNRVLRPGGKATIMVYSRSWWHFYVCGFLRGVFRNGLRSLKSFHHLAQAATDGAIARHYSGADWRALAGPLFQIDSIRIYGLKNELLPMPHSRFKDSLEDLIPNAFARLCTNHLHMGSFLVAHMRKA
jgi:SAM-dependent methyltransferase